jgi:hypothetical protein
MNLHLQARAFLAIALAAGLAAAADGLKSGPPVGEELPGTFEPLNITGRDAGEKTCILCEYGESPVAMVFAREVSEPVTRLIKRLDAATAQHKADSLASTVIFLSAEEGLVKQVKALAEKEKVRHTLLRSFKPEGPKNYDIAKDADVTVLLFLDRVVKANHAFKKGELQDKGIDAVVADIAKVLPIKK